MPRHAVAIGLLLLLTLSPSAAVPQSATVLDWTALGDEAVALLSRLLQTDTVNPPGNEIAAARLLKEVFDREGIEARVLESDPGRGSVWARLRGDGSRPSVVLLNHLDVVPFERQNWSVDPLGGAIKDGYVWGRGALDMKGMGAVEAVVLIALKRAGVPLRGDVVFLGTADEEAGGRKGAGFLVNRHWDLVKDAGVVINEGSSINRDAAGQLYYGVAVSEKVPLPIRLVAKGTAGHGSVPRTDNPVHRLVTALHRIATYATPIKVLPEVQSYYAAVAPFQSAPSSERFRDLRAALEDPAIAAELLKSNPFMNARTRNTISINMVEGSGKINVIPSEASAQIDVRLLPGEDAAVFLAELRRIIADDAVTIEATPRAAAAVSSPLVHPFFDALDAVRQANDPAAVMTTPLLTAATDCRYFRSRGVACYGFLPFVLSVKDYDGFHGNDERLSVENVHRGTRLLYDVVRRLAADPVK
jgi:acetylornithine deacetylase/succinyl-diaminopimelate desuccinylase-like protein